jgi:hypothetical protein
MNKILSLDKIKKTPDQKFEELRHYTSQILTLIMNELYEIDSQKEFHTQYADFFKIITEEVQRNPKISIDINPALAELPMNIKRLYSMQFLIEMIQQI